MEKDELIKRTKELMDLMAKGYEECLFCSFRSDTSGTTFEHMKVSHPGKVKTLMSLLYAVSKTTEDIVKRGYR
jgi:hypothetical protein